MFDDEDTGDRKAENNRQDTVPAVLDSLSVEELKAYRVRLEAEIGRIDTEIARKQDHRSAAESIFKS